MGVRSIRVLLAATVAFWTWGTPAGAAEEGSQRKAIPWQLVEVGPRQASVEVSFSYGGCEANPVGTAAESSNSIRITVTVESPSSPTVVCPTIARIGEIAVPLKSRLAGRRIDEATIKASTRVPRLVGSAPADASRIALSAGLFGERVRRVRAHVPRPVVRAQSPAAGAPIPRNGAARLEIAVPLARP